MAFLDRFRRTQKTVADDYPTRDPDSVLAYYLAPSGQLDAIKTGLAYPGAGNYMYGITSPYADIPIQSNPTGFAYGAIVSTWANRCTHIRKTIINRIPWSVVDRRTGKPIPGHPFEVAVRRANTRGQKIFMLHEWAQCIWGETFLWPVKNEFGYYSDLIWLNNLGMEVITLAGMIGGYSYAPITGGRVHQYRPNELVFYYTDNPFNNLRGLSPMDTILLEIGTDHDIARHLKAWYTNNARPGLMLLPKNDLSVFASQEFMDFWKAEFQGPANAGKPVLMPSIIADIKEIQESPKIDDIEQRLALRTEICAQYGVPLAIAGAWDDANYDSVDTQRKSLYEETIIPQTETIDDDFTERLLPFFDEWGTARIEHDFTNIKALMEDEGQKALAVNQRLVSGGISLNEYREQFDLTPLANGNVFYVPTGVTVTPAEQLGKQPSAPPLPMVPSNPVPAQLEKPMPQSQTPPQLPSGQSPEKPAVLPPPGAQAARAKADESKPLPPSQDPRKRRFEFEEYEILTPAQKAAWEESKHPREDNGQFGEGGGGSSSGAKPDQQEGADKPGDKPEKKPHKPEKKPEESPPDNAPDTRQYRDFSAYPETMVSDSFQPSAPKPNASQFEAMEYYRDISGNAQLNRNLRTGQPLPPEAAQHARELDGLLGSSKLEHDTMTYRGIASDNPQVQIFRQQIADGQLKPGSIMTDKGYASTTLNGGIAEDKFGDGGVVFKIKSPKGSEGLYMNAASDKYLGKRYEGEFRDEKELLLPRNSQYKIGKIEKNGNSYVVEMTYMGAGASAGKAFLGSSLSELAAWRKKAKNGGATKAMSFVCYELSKDIESLIRSKLKADMDDAALKAMFDLAEEKLKAGVSSSSFLAGKSQTLPEPVVATAEENKQDSYDYWQHYDALQAEIGDAWLTDYMNRVINKLSPDLRDHKGISDIEVQQMLTGLHEDLLNAWTGNQENPGPLTRIIMAGVAAGDAAITRDSAANPNRPVTLKAIGLTVDWALLPKEALEFVRTYAFGLIRRLDETTQKLVRKALDEWMQSEQPLDVLKQVLGGIFQDQARADNIAQTESSRAYFEGAKQRYQQAEVKQMQFRTANDSLVCPICGELHMTIGDINQGWWSDKLGRYTMIPTHPGCRCWGVAHLGD